MVSQENAEYVCPHCGGLPNRVPCKDGTWLCDCECHEQQAQDVYDPYDNDGKPLPEDLQPVDEWWMPAHIDRTGEGK